MAMHKIPENTLASLSNDNNLASWTNYQENNGYITLKIRYNEKPGTSSHYRRKSPRQVHWISTRFSDKRCRYEFSGFKHVRFRCRYFSVSSYEKSSQNVTCGMVYFIYIYIFIYTPNSLQCYPLFATPLICHPRLSPTICQSPIRHHVISPFNLPPSPSHFANQSRAHVYVMKTY